MKTVPLAEAYGILYEAAAVIIDNVVTYPSLDEITGRDDNEFLRLGWTDEEGLDFAVTFSEGPNLSVKSAGSSLWLIDEDGNEIEITVLVPANLEAADTGRIAKPS